VLCTLCWLTAAADSSNLPEGQRGTYAGVAAKVDHFKELGINAGGLF
jgi:pullulanase/glycogen debranching enzyme